MHGTINPSIRAGLGEPSASQSRPAKLVPLCGSLLRRRGRLCLSSLWIEPGRFRLRSEVRYADAPKEFLFLSAPHFPLDKHSMF